MYAVYDKVAPSSYQSAVQSSQYGFCFPDLEAQQGRGDTIHITQHTPPPSHTPVTPPSCKVSATLPSANPVTHGSVMPTSRGTSVVPLSCSGSIVPTSHSASVASTSQ